MIFHVLLDAEEGDIKAGDVNNVMEPNFVSQVGTKLNGAYAFDGTGGSPITQGNMWMGAVVRTEGVEQVACVDHVTVCTTVHNKFSDGRDSRTMV